MKKKKRSRKQRKEKKAFEEYMASVFQSALRKVKKIEREAER